MATYEFSATTKKDPTDVLLFFADMTNAAAWDPSIIRVERRDEGDISTTTSFDVTIKMGRRSLTLRYHVAIFEPGVRLILRAEGSWYVSEDIVSLSALSEGVTQVRYQARLSGRGPAQLLEPLFQRSIHQLGEAAGTKLRATYFA